MKFDRPFNQLVDIYRKVNQDNQELLKYVFEKSDSISLWIFSLSIGFISLFVSSFLDIQKDISYSLFKPILILLAISIISGIIYRLLYLYFFIVSNNAMRYIDAAFTNNGSMSIISTLDGKETFIEVVEKLKNEFGDDVSYLIPIYSGFNDKKTKDELYNSIVIHYINSIKFAQEDTRTAIRYVSDTYSKCYGLSKERVLKKMNNNSGKQYRWVLRITTLTYFIYISTFIGAIIVFIYKL